MKKTTLYFSLLMIACSVLLSILPSCVKDNSSEPGVEKVRPGDMLPEFSVVMNDGSKVSDKDLKGYVSVIVFFHTLCPDCRQELPVVQKVYERYAADDVKFIAISREEGTESVSEYWSENGIALPFSAQKDRRVYELFSTRGVPRIYIADREGTVRYVHSDVDMPSYEVLQDEIEDVETYVVSKTL